MSALKNTIGRTRWCLQENGLRTSINAMQRFSKYVLSQVISRTTKAFAAQVAVDICLGEDIHSLQRKARICAECAVLRENWNDSDDY